MIIRILQIVKKFFLLGRKREKNAGAILQDPQIVRSGNSERLGIRHFSFRNDSLNLNRRYDYYTSLEYTQATNCLLSADVKAYVHIEDGLLLDMGEN